MIVTLAFNELMFVRLILPYLFIAKFDFFFPESFGLTSPDYYFYLNQSGCYQVDGMNDVQEFKDTTVRLICHYHFILI